MQHLFSLWNCVRNFSCTLISITLIASKGNKTRGILLGDTWWGIACLFTKQKAFQMRVWMRHGRIAIIWKEEKKCSTVFFACAFFSSRFNRYIYWAWSFKTDFRSYFSNESNWFSLLGVRSEHSIILRCALFFSCSFHMKNSITLLWFIHLHANYFVDSFFFALLIYCGCTFFLHFLTQRIFNSDAW